jgi:hypothetical protein
VRDIDIKTEEPLAFLTFHTAVMLGSRVNLIIVTVILFERLDTWAFDSVLAKAFSRVVHFPSTDLNKTKVVMTMMRDCEASRTDNSERLQAHHTIPEYIYI